MAERRRIGGRKSDLGEVVIVEEYHLRVDILAVVFCGQSYAVDGHIADADLIKLADVEQLIPF